MQLNQFRFLIAIEKYGSISRAAQELYISQSTISLSLIHLEEEVGFTILNRSKRGVSFTPEGKEVLKRAQIIYEALESLKEIHQVSDEIIGDVRVAGNSHLGMNIITDAMLMLKNNYEGIRVSAHRGYIKDVLKEVAQMELDLAFINFRSDESLDILNDIKRHQLEFHRIFTDTICVCTREAHPLQNCAEVSLKDIKQYERVTMATRRDVLQDYSSRESEQSIVTINDIANLRKFVSLTDAITIIPTSEVLRGNEVYSYKLYALTVKDFQRNVVGGWVHHKGHEMLPAEQCVVNTLESVCKQYMNI